MFSAEQYNVIRPRHMSRKYTHSTLPQPYIMDNTGLGELGWSLKRMVKQIKEVAKHPLQKPLKTLALLNPITAPIAAPMMGLKKETKGRLERRIGGAIVGGAAGFLTGGPVGMVIGGTTGLAMAKKGTKGIIGYGKIGLIGGAAGGAGAFAVGTGAQTLYGAGMISQTAAQTAVMSSGAAGMYGMGVAAGAPIFGSMGSLLTTAGTIAKAIIPSKPPAMTAGPEEYSSVAAPTGQGLYSDNWTPPSPPSSVGQGYMDLIKQTTGAVPSLLQSAGGPNAEITSPTGQSYDSGLMPQDTGDYLPGQGPGYAEAGIFSPENLKWWLLGGGVVALIALAGKRR